MEFVQKHEIVKKQMTENIQELKLRLFNRENN